MKIMHEGRAAVTDGPQTKSDRLIPSKIRISSCFDSQDQISRLGIPCCSCHLLMEKGNCDSE